MPKLTKAERDRQEQEAREARIRAALHWTDRAAGPDVLPPSCSDSSGQMSTGYTFNAYTNRVDVACSSSIGHAIGRTDKTDSQRPLSLYSTRLLALKAQRGWQRLIGRLRERVIPLESERVRDMTSQRLYAILRKAGIGRAIYYPATGWDSGVHVDRADLRVAYFPTQRETREDMRRKMTAIVAALQAAGVRGTVSEDGLTFRVEE